MFAEWGKLINGNILRTDAVEHYCSPESQCGCMSPTHTRERIKKLFVQLVYRRRPQSAKTSEWMRVRDPYDRSLVKTR